MRKKSMNDLANQFKKLAKKTKNFMKVYSAYLNAFQAHFNTLPHTKGAKNFIDKYGCDYPA